MFTNNIFIPSSKDRRYEVHVENGLLILKDIADNRYLRISHGQDKLLKYIHDGCALSICESMFASLLTNGPGLGGNASRSRRWYNKKIVQCDGFFLRRLVIPRTVFTIPAILIGILVSSIGAVGQIAYLKVSVVPMWLSVVWLLVNIVGHEFGHALCCVSCGREVLSFGIKLNYGIPMMYVGTSDICMAPRKDRIRTSLAGVYVNGLLLLGLLLIQGIEATSLGNLEMISLAIIWLNLIPFMKLDGYYILEDMLGEHGLSKAGFIEIKQMMYGRISECNKVLLLYGLSESIFLMTIIFLIMIRCIRMLSF